MSDVAQGPGWWIASDGKWYPPEQHPSVRDQAREADQVRAAAGPATPARAGQAGSDFVSGPPGALPVPEPEVPAAGLPSFWGGDPGADAAAPAPQPIPPPPPVIIPQIRTPRQRPVPPATPASGGVELANGPSTGLPADQPVAAPAGGYGGQRAPLSPYEEGVYAGAELTRRRRRRGLPIWWAVIIIVVAAGATAGTFFYLRESNPHRSAATIAEDYLSAVASHNQQQMKADVIPGQVPITGGFKQTQLSFAITSEVGDGPDKNVNLLVCSGLYSGASCSNEIDGAQQGYVPTRQVDDKWYVDVDAFPPCQAGTTQLVCVTLP